MKKLIFATALLLCASVMVFAQTEERALGTTTKSGKQILPQAGDFGLSIDATPILDYLGGFLSNGGGSGASFDAPDFTITGQYFLTNDRSIRASLNLGFGSTTRKFISATDVDKEDSRTISNSELFLSVGYAFHRGYGRLQAYYGPEIGLGFAGSKTTWKYGDPLSATNLSRANAIETKAGTSFEFGLGGFLGVEYFFAPKMSIGGEFGLGLRFASVGESLVKNESWDIADSKVKTEENTTPGRSSFDFGTVPTGSINVTFYF